MKKLTRRDCIRIKKRAIDALKESKEEKHRVGTILPSNVADDLIYYTKNEHVVYNSRSELLADIIMEWAEKNIYIKENTDD